MQRTNILHKPAPPKPQNNKRYHRDRQADSQTQTKDFDAVDQPNPEVGLIWGENYRS